MIVLVVEDEEHTLQLLRVYFEAKGHEVITAIDGIEALDKFNARRPDLMLLDVMLPRLDGWGVLQAVRAQSDIPVIFLTSLDSTEDVVRGLVLGGDDYLRKPFRFDELDARVQALLRRIQDKGKQQTITIGPLQIDDRAKSVKLDDKIIHLSPREYDLLKLLASDPGRVFSSEEIIARLWPLSRAATSADVKQYMHLLRNKIARDPKDSALIQTVKGFGYKLIVDVTDQNFEP